MSPAERARRPARLPLMEAAALGAAHGIAELLPVSSSAHVTALAWLLRWRYIELPPQRRKEFEVALHLGSTGALAILLREQLPKALLQSNRGSLLRLGLASAPAAIAGAALERPVEQRLATPAAVAAGLGAGALALALGDTRPQSRAYEDARAADAAWIGIAQAAALAPGTSRSGLTLAAARWRGFGRQASQRLSWEAGFPVLLGAGLLKGLRLAQAGSAPSPALWAGAGASFASTLAFGRVVARGAMQGELWPFAAYRVALAVIIGGRLCQSRERRPRLAWARRLL